MDSQHKNLIVLTERLLASSTKKELLKNNKLLYKHVKNHFSEEEALMKNLNYHVHEKEHTKMFKKPIKMDRRINDDNWVEYIIHFDMSVNHYIKQQQQWLVKKQGKTLMEV